MKTALEIAKEVIASKPKEHLPEDSVIVGVTLLLAEAVVSLTEDWEAENQALNVLRSICKGKSQALKEAAEAMEAELTSNRHKGHECPLREWLAKYGEKK